ncbi:hypothetical protein AK812_SmicGene808 [Symbiodinium microadriaticum]|uniref:Uncharacterized protein n=1 Tax=Symbiodinium microadriaticum TaxID=2951 RepID=A0A1Q9F5R2_SYMMI|nr:hypothetical protein AK812_SmicGene808 [Symbiodinium microadriaticum]
MKGTEVTPKGNYNGDYRPAIGRGDTQLLVPDRFLKFTSIQAAAFDESGKEMATVASSRPDKTLPKSKKEHEDGDVTNLEWYELLAVDVVGGESDGAVEGEFVILNTKSSGNYTLHRVHDCRPGWDENKNWTENLTMSASRNYRNFADCSTGLYCS